MIYPTPRNNALSNVAMINFRECCLFQKLTSSLNNVQILASHSQQSHAVQNHQQCRSCVTHHGCP